MTKKNDLLAEAKRAEMDGDLAKAKRLREQAMGKDDGPVEETPRTGTAFPIKGQPVTSKTSGRGSGTGSPTSQKDETPASEDE